MARRSGQPPRICIAGTADTKAAELFFLRSVIAEAGAHPFVVDVGTRERVDGVDVAAAAVAAHHPDGPGAVLGGNDRGSAVAAMAEAFRRYLVANADGIDAVVGIGGSGGTSIVTAGMRALAIGVPKIMVSTLASSDVAPFVGVSDIVMMPSVTDLAGLNRITRTILAQAGAAIVAMANAGREEPAGTRAVGLTMFGVTTPAVTAIVERLGGAHECMVFHATGTGGRAMETLARGGWLDGIIDVTTTEICDLLFGGVLPAAPDRLDVVADTRLPYVGSVGALDMINFWAPETMPDAMRGRRLYEHNRNITLVRTTVAECREIGAWIARKLDRCTGPVRFLIPEHGVSALDVVGGPFFDRQADAALFEAIERGATWGGARRLVRLPCHINDAAFADAVVANWRELGER
jgi:uncharacterized protein (UPF0261 family)